VKLDLYARDPDFILGWKLLPGKYTLTARYAFARAPFLTRCKTGCENHADPLRPWSSALEMTREASLEIVVR
jgi:hypothetical protein